MTDGVPAQVLLEDVDAEVVLPEGFNVSDLVGKELEISEAIGGASLEDVSADVLPDGLNVLDLVGADFEISGPIGGASLEDASLEDVSAEVVVPASLNALDLVSNAMTTDDSDPDDPDDPNYSPQQSNQSPAEESSDEVLPRPKSPNQENEVTQKRKRNRKAVPEDWEKNKIKKLRMHGQNTGYERKKVNDKMVVS